MSRDESQAAYFTLLRAREEFAALERYAEFLGEEQRRVRRFMAEGAALADTVDHRLRRSMRHIDTQFLDAITQRMAWIDDERGHLPDRIAAAAAFVAACEQEHRRLSEPR